MNQNKKLLFLLIMVICLIVLDQLIKFVVVINIYNSGITIFKGILNFTYVENTGGAFGLGNNNILIFIIINIAIIALITKHILTKKDEVDRFTLIGLGLVLSGGVSNLIDRIFRGFVIDYIDINPLIKYPMFNFADICIVIGCILVIINLIRKK